MLNGWTVRKMRKKVFVQVYDQVYRRWHNYMGFDTYERAVEVMKNYQKEYPNAKVRVLDNNLITHTK